MRAVIISIVLMTLMAQVLGQEPTVAPTTPATIPTSPTAAPSTQLPVSTTVTSNTTSASTTTLGGSGSSAATWSPAITLIALASGLAALIHRF